MEKTLKKEKMKEHNTKNEHLNSCHPHNIPAKKTRRKIDLKLRRKHTTDIRELKHVVGCVNKRNTCSSFQQHPVKAYCKAVSKIEIHIILNLVNE